MESPQCGELLQFAMDLPQLGWEAELCLAQTVQGWLQLLK